LKNFDFAVSKNPGAFSGLNGVFIHNLGVDVKRTAVRWTLMAPTLFMLVVVNQLDKTNVPVIVADHRFRSDSRRPAACRESAAGRLYIWRAFSRLLPGRTCDQSGLLAAPFRVELVGVGATPSKIHFDPIQKNSSSF
jgi:hypothetical protein